MCDKNCQARSVVLTYKQFDQLRDEWAEDTKFSPSAINTNEIFGMTIHKVEEPTIKD